MPLIRIIDWDSVKDQFLGRTVSQLDRSAVASVAVKEAPRLAIRDVGVTLAGTATLAIHAFNDPQDDDDEHVIGVAGTFTADGELVDPRIPYNAQNAWLRYSLVGELTADATARLRGAGINVSASSQVVLSDYRRHNPFDRADTGVLADLASARTALDVDHVAALGRGEALYYELRGDLLFFVSVSWSDIFAKTLSDIASLLPTSKTFAVAARAGASSSFKVTLTDDFVIVFWRDQSGTLHGGVRKASSRGTAFAATVSVTASFADPSAVAEAAESVLHGYFGEGLATIDHILSKATGADLTGDEKRIFDAVMEALGLDPVVALAAEAKGKLGRLRSAVEAKLEEAAETRIGASWNYDYSRLESTQYIVEAPLTETQLRRLHSSLVAQDVSPLLAEAESGALQLTRYLDETTVVRSSAHGFSLGIGKWFEIGDRDRSRLTIRTRRSRDRTRSMISYIGARSFGGAKNWSIGQFDFDFRAEMAAYAVEPKTSDFDFGLALAMTATPRKLTPEAIAAIVDTASLWAIIASERPHELREMLAAIGSRTVTARYQLTFDKQVLRQIAPLAGVRDCGGMAGAIAAAMPWGTFAARSSWQTRRELYAAAWRVVLAEQAGAGEACDVVRHALHAADPAMAQLDATDAHMWTLRSLIDGHPQIVSHYSTWTTGARLLGAAVGEGTLASSKIETIFEDLYGFFSQVLYVRAIGRYLIDIAAAAGQTAAVGRVLSIAYDAGKGDRKTVTIGSKG